MEGEAEEAFFVFLVLVIDFGLDVEEGFDVVDGRVLIVLNEEQLAILRDEEEAVGAVGGARDGDGPTRLDVREGKRTVLIGSGEVSTPSAANTGLSNAASVVNNSRARRRRASIGGELQGNKGRKRPWVGSDNNR